MQIYRIDRSRAHPPDRPENFSGTVRMQELVRSRQPGAIELIMVFFEAGARTIPHVHETDQALHILEGEGVVATETETRAVKAGDIVVIPAGAWHWHGAAPHAPMCHLVAKPAGGSRWDVPRRNWEAMY